MAPILTGIYNGGRGLYLQIILEWAAQNITATYLLHNNIKCISDISLCRKDITPRKEPGGTNLMAKWYEKQIVLLTIWRVDSCKNFLWFHTRQPLFWYSFMAHFNLHKLYLNNMFCFPVNVVTQNIVLCIHGVLSLTVMLFLNG